jgi:hypothetical protein
VDLGEVLHFKCKFDGGGSNHALGRGGESRDKAVRRHFLTHLPRSSLGQNSGH